MKPISRRKLSHVRARLRASGTAADLRKLHLRGIHFRDRIRKGPTEFTSRDTSLRVLAHVPRYPPLGLGGAETSIKTTVDFLLQRGHQVTVIADLHPRGRYSLDGIEVRGCPTRKDIRQAYSAAEVVLTQQSSSVGAFMHAARTRVPVVHLVRDIGDWRRLPASPDLLVFNAEWQRDMFEYGGRSFVLHSPVFLDRYRTTRGAKVTLINMNRRKGVELFLDIVERMPRTDFLGVTGMWGEQVIPDPVPRNLRLVNASDDPRTIYSETRVLLIPSKWESYGRVAVEAAASGIPIIASPNPGTIEAVGFAGIYANRSDPEEWVRAIESLTDLNLYRAASEAILRAAHRVDTIAELSAFEVELLTLAPFGVN